MRNISFSMSTAAVRNRSKTVTRRLGWWNRKPEYLAGATQVQLAARYGVSQPSISKAVRGETYYQAVGKL